MTSPSAASQVGNVAEHAQSINDLRANNEERWRNRSGWIGLPKVTVLSTMVSIRAKWATHIDKDTPVGQYARQTLQIHRAALSFGRRPANSVRLQDMQCFHLRQLRNAVVLGKAHDNHRRLLCACIKGIYNSVTKLWTLQQRKHISKLAATI